MAILKSKEFAQLAKKAGISDSALYRAAQEIETGLIDADIGKFLVKKRIPGHAKGKSGGFRTIVCHREGERIIFLYLFAKNAKGNLTKPEVEAWRLAAKAIADISIRDLITAGYTEVEDGDEA